MKKFKKRKIHIDDSFLRHNTQISNYYKGFIAADGHINDTDRRMGKTSRAVLEIDISQKDDTILAFLHSKLPASKLYRYGRNCDNNGIIIERKFSKLRQVLSNKTETLLKTTYNITPKKSLTLEPPKLSNKSEIKAFIIGYIDGDGCIRRDNSHRLQFTLVGTQSFLVWVRDFLEQEYQISRTKISKRGNYWAYCLSGSYAKKVLSNLNKINVPKLQRKWKTIEEIV